MGARWVVDIALGRAFCHSCGELTTTTKHQVAKGHVSEPCETKCENGYEDQIERDMQENGNLRRTTLLLSVKGKIGMTTID